MPADIVPGLHRLIATGSTAGLDGTTAPTTSSAAVYTRSVDNHGSVITVRSSTDYNTSLTSTQTSAVNTYGGVVGAIVAVDQSAVAASSALGGTGAMTHTIQIRDPLSGNYQNSTGVITTSTAIATFTLICYPGMGTASPSSAGVGKADLALGTDWRVSSVASSSATNFTYSISAIPIPTSASSS